MATMGREGINEYFAPSTVPAKVWFISIATQAESRVESRRKVIARASGIRGSKKPQSKLRGRRKSTVSRNRGRKKGSPDTKVTPEMSSRGGGEIHS